MTQELAWTRDAVRAMNQCQRTALHVRQNPRTDALVIAREFKFGEIEIRVDQPVRM
jgi:hypothetical protein